jgi:predicted ATPase
VAVPHNVPAALTSLVGRAREIADLRRLLATTRYLTLTGVGGAGKTRVAREVAALAAGADAARAAAGDGPTHGPADGHRAAPAVPAGGDGFAGGVWWVELAPLAPGAEVAPALAVALGVAAPPGRALAAAAEAIGARRALLVLDNCEHVVGSCAAAADALLRACPALTVLATSRGALGGDGETVWQLPRLSHPRLAPGAPPPAAAGARPPATAEEVAALAGYDSVRLFVARAGAASPRFALGPHNAAAVRAVCARLDGLPLALELAAANAGVLGVEQIAARLDDAFAVLTRGRRTALPRHRTLAAMLDWSYDLLGPAERRLLARLSVFRAAVPLDAVEAVGADGPAPAGAGDGDAAGGAGLAAGEPVLGALAGLVEHSLVDVVEGDGESRYRLLETVRQYAAARLRAAPDDEAAARGRHARWVAGLADAMGEETGSPRRGRAMARFHPLVEDARAALDWSTGPGGDPADALRVAGGLAIFWHWAGLWTEGRRRAEGAVRRADAAAAARGEADDARRPLAERVALAKALQTALLLAWMLGEPEATLAHAARALPLWATAEADPRGRPGHPCERRPVGRLRPEILAFARFALGDVAGAEASVERRSRRPTVRGAAGREGSRSAGAPCSRRPPAARPTPPATSPAPRRSWPRVGDTWVLSWCYANGAAAAIAQGDRSARRAWPRSGVAALRSEPDWHYVSRGLDALAAAGAAWLASPAAAAHPAAARDACARTAATLLGAAAGVRDRSGTAVWPFDGAARAAAAAAVRAALDPGRLRRVLRRRGPPRARRGVRARRRGARRARRGAGRDPRRPRPGRSRPRPSRLRRPRAPRPRPARPPSRPGRPRRCASASSARSPCGATAPRCRPTRGGRPRRASCCCTSRCTGRAPASRSAARSGPRRATRGRATSST